MLLYVKMVKIANDFIMFKYISISQKNNLEDDDYCRRTYYLTSPELINAPKWDRRYICII